MYCIRKIQLYQQNQMSTALAATSECRCVCFSVLVKPHLRFLPPPGRSSIAPRSPATPPSRAGRWPLKPDDTMPAAVSKSWRISAMMLSALTLKICPMVRSSWGFGVLKLRYHPQTAGSPGRNRDDSMANRWSFVDLK